MKITTTTWAFAIISEVIYNAGCTYNLLKSIELAESRFRI